ncbi:DUF3015 family protein [uncultured Salinisphaera sp.]|uniref:DUF3015 family protein n=1 Tax=uncultured Salinisphaera sp. TaxID=359372 RepID=UPI0032B13C09|tara:strand:+ start:3048 stop:3410 length:363 start_codon:yes stop_codon:yes gene_type:complete
MNKTALITSLTAGALIVPGMAHALDKNDFTTTASTAATTAYIVGNDDEDLVKAREFADSQKLALARESAQGGGEHVAGLAELLGENPAELGAWMQDNYSALYTGQTDRNLIDRITALQTG